MELDNMALKKIDKMKANNIKVALLIAYGKKYNCLHEMSEIYDIYQIAKRKYGMTTEQWNDYQNASYEMLWITFKDKLILGV